jgi:thiol-disulfide isomerase/thioredoxin
LLVLLSAAAIVSFSVRSTRAPKTAEIGVPAQDFELVDSHNNTVKFSDMRGSVVFLNFWATWCGSCVEELPNVERLYRSLSENSSFKMVTILYRDGGEQAASYMSQNGYTFPVYLNSDESAARIFGITGVPETFIIDKKGILRDKVLGPAQWDSPKAIASLRALIQEP